MSRDELSQISKSRTLIILFGVAALAAASACVTSHKSDDKSSRLPATSASDFWSHFPTDPPFEVDSSEVPRFQALWKRALCLYPARAESLKLEKLNRLFHHKIHGCLDGRLK